MDESLTVSTTSISASAPSPLLPLVIPLSQLSQRYRRQLPLLLPALLNPSAASDEPPSLGAEGIDHVQWRALRSGLAVWVGARSTIASSGPRGAETPGRTEEEQADKIRQNQISEEERLLNDGKRWLEGMERRE